MEKFLSIIKSWRFWVVVFIAVTEAVQAEGYLQAGAADIIISALQYISGGAAAVRTVDRLGEKAGESEMYP